MVTAARLSWACNQMVMGRQASIRLNTHPDKVVLHVCLLPKFDVQMRNVMAIHLLEQAVEHLPSVLSVDHGHQKSNGICRFTVVFRPLPTAGETAHSHDVAGGSRVQGIGSDGHGPEMLDIGSEMHNPTREASLLQKTQEELSDIKTEMHRCTIDAAVGAVLEVTTKLIPGWDELTKQCEDNSETFGQPLISTLKNIKAKVLELEARLPALASEHGHECLAQVVSGEIAEIMEERDDCMAKVMTAATPAAACAAPPAEPVAKRAKSDCSG